MKVTLSFDDSKLADAGLTTPEQVRAALLNALNTVVGEYEGSPTCVETEKALLEAVGE
jgi:hypothetical protein